MPVWPHIIHSGHASTRFNGHDVIHIPTTRALVPLERRRPESGVASAAILEAAGKRTLKLA
jgi:hypothetical protein